MRKVPSIYDVRKNFGFPPPPSPRIWCYSRNLPCFIFFLATTPPFQCGRQIWMVPKEGRRSGAWRRSRRMRYRPGEKFMMGGERSREASPSLSGEQINGRRDSVRDASKFQEPQVSFQQGCKCRLRDLISCSSCVHTSQTDLKADCQGSSGILTGSEVSQLKFQLRRLFFRNQPNASRPSNGKKHKLGHYLAVAQLIHRSLWADISSTKRTTLWLPREEEKIFAVRVI